MGIGIGLAALATNRQTHNDAVVHDDEELLNRPSVERETGIEPASLAWKARVLPLNYSRLCARLYARLAAHFYARLRHSIPSRISLVERGGFEPP